MVYLGVSWQIMLALEDWFSRDLARLCIPRFLRLTQLSPFSYEMARPMPNTWLNHDHQQDCPLPSTHTSVIPCSVDHSIRNSHLLDHECNGGIHMLQAHHYQHLVMGCIRQCRGQARWHCIKQSLTMVCESARHRTAWERSMPGVMSYLEPGRSHVPLAVPGTRFPLRIDEYRDQAARSTLLR